MKKIIAIVTALLLCFSIAAGADYQDTAGSKYEEAISILSKLFLVEGDEDGAFRPEDEISRSEFTAYVVRMLAMESVAKGITAEQKFQDVPTDHWAFGYITLADQLGIINGAGDGTFRPDEAVTGQDAVKIVTSALGYDALASRSGGYPTGYLIAGQRAKIFDKLADVSMAEPMTRGEAAQLIYNALEAPMMQTDGMGKLEESDKTVLSDYLKVDQYTGVVTANEFTSLSGPDTVKKGYVRIETTDGLAALYQAGETKALELLGYRVEYYSYQNDDARENEILWIKPEREEQWTLTLDADAIERDATLSHFGYIDDERSVTADIAPDAQVVYNGKVYEAGKEELLRPALGSIRLIDNTKDGFYNVLVIEDFRGYVVDHANEQNDTLVVMKNGYNVFSVSTKEDSSHQLVIYRESETIAPAELKQGDVIAVTKSKDESVTVIRAGGEMVTGSVEELWSDNEEQHARLSDGGEYILTAGVSRAVKLGDSGGFYLIDNKIVATVFDAALSEDYAFMINCSAGTGLSNPQIKLMHKDGTIRIYDTAEHVSVTRGYQKQRYDSADAKFYSLLEKFREELLIVSVNGEGKVSQLELPTDNSLIEGYVGYMEDVFTKDKNATLYYKPVSPPTLGGVYMMTDDTIVFDVAKLTPTGNPVSEEDYYAGNYEVFGKDRSYIVDIYDSTPNMKAKAVVIRVNVPTEAVTPWNSACFLVEKLVAVLDSDGTQRTAVTGLVGGQRATEILKDDVLDEDKKTPVLEMLEPGAVIQIKKHMDGEVENVRVLYLPSDDQYQKERSWSGSEANIDLYTTYGMVTYAEPDVISVSMDGGQTSKPFAIGDAKLYKFNAQKKTCLPADYEDITPSRESLGNASKVFIRAYRNEVGEIIIYED